MDQLNISQLTEDFKKKFGNLTEYEYKFALWGYLAGISHQCRINLEEVTRDLEQLENYNKV
jgi:hypothetical protein